MFSKSIRAVTKFSSLLPLSSIPLCKCTTTVLSTHLLMNTWTASKSLTFVNNTAMNIVKNIFFELVFQVSSDKFLEMELLGYKAVPCLIF